MDLPTLKIRPLYRYVIATAFNVNVRLIRDHDVHAPISVTVLDACACQQMRGTFHNIILMSFKFTV